MHVCMCDICRGASISRLGSAVMIASGLVYVCVCVCVCVCLYANDCIYAYVFMCLCIFVCVCDYACVRICIHVCG